MTELADVDRRCETFPAFREMPAYDVPYCWSAIMRGAEECRCEGTPIGDANLADDAWRRAVLMRWERFRQRAQARGVEARRQRELASLRMAGLEPLETAVEIADRQATYPWRTPNRPTLVRYYSEDRG